MAKERTVLRIAAVVAVLPLLIGAAPPAQLAQALAAQRALVAEQPTSAGALNDLANLLVEAGQLDEAEEAYRRAMTIEPGRPEPPYNLALLLGGRNQRREARRLLRAMLEDHPDHAWGHYQLGTLQHARGDRGRALRSYREAFRLDPSLSDARRNPHVVDNELATAAMLEAFALIAPAATSQRLYVEPSRISGLLLPPLTAEPTEPMAPPAADDEPAEEPQEVEPAPGTGPEPQPARSEPAPDEPPEGEPE